MARKPRIEFPGVLLHVIARGNNRQEIFHDDEDRRAYLERLGLYLGEGGVTISFLTVESTRVETAGCAPAPRENTLEGRGLVLAVSGRAVLGGRTAPCLRGARCSPKNAGSPDVKVVPERRGVYCMGDSPPRGGSNSMAPKRDS